MVARIFKFAVIVVLVAIAVYFLTQESNQKAFKEAWSDVQQSDGWKMLRKTWLKAYKKTQQLIAKAQEGTLSEEIAIYVDTTTRSYLGVGLNDLEEYLDSLSPSRVGTILFVAWLIIGYIFYKISSVGTSLFIMAMTILVHSIYGQTWCLYQLIVLIGLLMFLFSLVANNVVIAAIIVLVVYSITTFVFFLGNEGASLHRVEEKIDHIHYRTAKVEHRVSDMNKKLDKLVKKSRDSSGGED